MGEEVAFQEDMRPSEYDDGLKRITHHLFGRHGAAIVGFLERRPGHSHHRARPLADSRGASASAPADAQVGDVVVCASGNLGLVYLMSSPGRLTREQIDSSHPGLIDTLVHHPGVGMLVLHSEQGLVAVGAGGSNLLDQGVVHGRDPLEAYGPTAADGLRRIAGFEASGDFIAIGTFDPSTDQVVSFEELVGSHGGLGGPQSEAFIAYRSAWRLDGEPLIGSPAINAQLRQWLSDLRERHP